MQHVRKHERERLVADELARAPYRMAEAERLLLAREARLAGGRLSRRELFELSGLIAARAQRRLEFELLVEMVLDRALAAPGDEDEVLDAGLARLVDDDAGSTGRSTTVSISFGIALVAGRKRVPRPATGNTALRMGFMKADRKMGAGTLLFWPGEDKSRLTLQLDR